MDLRKKRNGRRKTKKRSSLALRKNLEASENKETKALSEQQLS
jgi:hypothetical protein